MREEANHEAEPTKRQWLGFWSMIVQQTQNAFNDKAAQFLLVPLAGAVGATVFGMGVESLAGVLIALPFVLFAPLAGWLSDRFSKRDVMLGAAVAQLLILVWLWLSVLGKRMDLALLGFFALAVQSAFFSPAKIGINKELVGSKHLGFAAGIQQMTAMLAILAGQIAMGFVFDAGFKQGGGSEDAAWRAAEAPLHVIMWFGLPAILMAWIVPRTKAQGSERLSWRTGVAHFTHLRELWSEVGLRRGSIGVAFFWGFAAFINIWSIKVAKDLTAGGEGFGTLQSWFMAAASAGMVAGFGLSAWLLRKRIELGWVPLAGVVMTISTVALAMIPADGALAFSRVDGIAALFASLFHPGKAAFLWGLGLVAFSAAVFLAPLNAWMQDHYPAAKRGEMQSAVNLQDCLAGILAVVFVELGTKLFGLRGTLLAVGLGCGLMTWFIMRLLPAEFIRTVFDVIIGTVYRIRPVGLENLPEKGGVLLLPNHVSYADAFFLSAASPRPIRFVMDEVFTSYPVVRRFTEFFQTVTIRRDQPLEAMRKIFRALDAGEVVCFFPEGQLTRTGTLCPIQPGIGLIARKAACPMIPVWCDGSWGSVFSFERNRYFKKWPRWSARRMCVAFGTALRQGAVDPLAVRGALLETSSAALAGLGAESWQVINGHQIGMVNALGRRGTIHALRDDPARRVVAGLFDGFPRAWAVKLVLHDSFNPSVTGPWIGGGMLQSQIPGKTTTSTVCYLFCDEPNVGEAYPCLAIEGRVIAMSMPDPPCSTEGGYAPQLGRKPGSWGRLLPGWHIRDGVVHGPAAPPEGLRLPDGAWLDEDGFLIR